MKGSYNCIIKQPTGRYDSFDQASDQAFNLPLHSLHATTSLSRSGSLAWLSQPQLQNFFS